MRTIYGPIFTLRPYERGIQEIGEVQPVVVAFVSGGMIMVALKELFQTARR